MCFLALLAVPAAAEWVKTAAWAAQPFMSQIIAAPFAPNRVYASTGSTPELLISDDGGATWRTISTKTAGSPYRLVVDPLDRDTIYVIMSNLGQVLYKSTDAGATLTRLGEYVGVAIDPKHPGVLYAIHPQNSGGGIAKSIDGGVTWFDTARGHSAHSQLAIDPNDSLIVYANGYELPVYDDQFVGGFYRTLDGGMTWPSMFEGYTAVEFLTVDAASRVYSIVGYGFQNPLLRSADHGESWSRLDRGMPSEPNLEGAGPLLRSVAFDPKRKETIYVGALGDGVFVSFDDGVQWQTLGEIPDRMVNMVAAVGDGVVLAATPSGVYRYVPPPPRRRAVRPPAR